MISTEEPLNDKDIFLRSIWPANKKPDYWNGYRLVSSAFKDPKGLSVSRVYTRSMDEAVGWMKANLQGPVYSITYTDCKNVNAEVKNKPSRMVPYHYEIHGGKETVLLSEEQALLLSRRAKRESD